MSDNYCGEDLIFIISMPRSGSTLLQRVLAGHPEVGASSEPWIMLHQAYGRRQDGIYTEYGADWAALGVNEFVEHYTDGDNAYDDAVRAFARSLYGSAMRKAGVQRFIDKTPRYVLIVEELIRLFPAARFVFLKRNPLSVLASIVNSQISHDLSTLERFTSELLVGPKAILTGIETLGERAIEVRYEDFVTDPEAELKRICARLDLSYQAEMLDYADSPEIKGFMQDRVGVQQHNRPVAARAHAWRQMLNDPQQLEFARGYLADLGADVLSRFGYDHEEMSATVRQASERNRPSGYIYPWNIAILSPDAKRGRDQMQVLRYRAIRDHGPVLGRLKMLPHYVRGIIKAFEFIFGSALSRKDVTAEERARAGVDKRA